MTAENATSALDFTVKDIDGDDVPLSQYSGKVVLIVNVASKCGLTPQYEDLQRLHERYAEDGLAILGFPANNFLRQEQVVRRTGKVWRHRHQETNPVRVPERP